MKSAGLSMGQQLQQTLSPRLQRAVKLLQMSSMEYSHQIYDVVANNPFLDIDESNPVSPHEAPESTAAGVLATAEAANLQVVPELPIATSSTPDHEGEGSDNFEADHEIWKADDRAASSMQREGHGISAIDMHKVDESLVTHLYAQICVMPLTDRDRTIAESIVGSLDDDGYLRTPLEDVAAVTGLIPKPDMAEMHIGLSRIHALDPPGVGARDVSECLLLQLGDIACPDTRAQAQTIIQNHLNLLAANDINGLAKALGSTPDAVQPTVDCIRSLIPKPGWLFDSHHAQYVMPDVIVRKQRGQWTAHLNPAVIPRVRVYQTCVDMFRTHHTGQHSELAAHLQEARWTLSNIEQRFSTILAIAEAIMRRQKLFLEYGPLAMKPLGLREIADEVGVHESTVSRVTNNKFMATPQGVFELKYFFSRSLATAVGGECSATAIRSLIQDLIAAENTSAPLSDAAIRRLLERQGFVLARRTVTKYRQALRIESFEKRRTLS